MSGDVQPRKRKEKRKKKEGGSLGTIHDQTSFQKFSRDFDEKKHFDLPPDQGEKIHVQNEHGIGGNICVKIIFFCLLGLLVGAIGLIYQQYQGSTDVDLPSIEESRFAEYFTGWLDDGADDHEHESLENLAQEESNEHDENNEMDEHADEEEGEDEEEEDEEHNEGDDERDEAEDQSPEEQNEPGLFSRILGIQKDSENDEGESVDEEFIKSEVNEVNEEMHDSEIDEEDDDENENEYNDRNYRSKRGRHKNDDDDDNDDDNEHEDGENDEDEDEDTSNLGEEVEEENNESEEIGRKSESVKKDYSTVEDDDKDSGIDDDDDDIDDDDEEKYDASQQDNMSNEKSDIKNEEDDDDEDGAKEEEEDEGEENLKKESSEELNDKDEEEEQQIDKDDEDDDNVSADQDFGDQDDSKHLEEEEEEEDDEEEEKKKNSWTNDEDLGYDEIDESEEDAGDENKKKEDDDDNDDDDEGEGENIDTIAKLKKDLPHKPEADIDETAKEAEGKSEAEAEEVLDEDANEGGVAVKLGVGIALIIVAHLVLVQKWKAKGNASPDESAPSDKISEEEEVVEKKKIENLTSQSEEVISRRQTLVPEDAFPSNKFKCEEIDDEELEEEEGEKDEEEEVDSEEYSGEEEEHEEPIVIKQKDKGQNLGSPIVKISRSLLNADKEEEEEEEDDDEEEEDYGSEDVADEEEYEENDEDFDNEEEYVEEEEEEDDEEIEEKESGEETDDNFEEDTELDNSKLKKQQQQRVSQAEDTPPTPPPRTHKRGPQDVDEELDEFMGHEDLSQTVPQGVEEILRNLPPPEEPKSSEKETENDDDWYFREELSYADLNFENNPKASLKAYDKILSKKATAVRALIGRARVLDHLAEKERSNAYLKQATNAYKALLLEHGNLLRDEMYLKLAERCIERMRFGGYLGSAIEVHKGMILRFPNTPKYRNTLAVTYLMLNKIELARKVLKETLTLWPGNGFALVHYGFILKTTDNNMEEAVRKLTAGIETKDEGVIDGMFFFHLGDALNRLGRPQEAMKWYDLGVKEGLFLSKYQRSLYNVNRLRGQPWWSKEETTYQSFFKRLEDNWREIQKEGLALLNSKGVNLFKEETENLKDTGDWRQLDLYFRGRQQSNCKLAPVTCSLVSSFKPAAGCTRGQIKFSVMLPDTHVWPHCGPTNCRLRSHLGLIVPKFTYIRVAEETRSWEEGKFIIFDDSFEHEVWHNGTGPRLVLIVDVWHPELTQQERQSLSPI